MTTPRITNREARAYVQECREFKANNINAGVYRPTLKDDSGNYISTRPCTTFRYVVFSYGAHFPMFIAEWGEDQTPAEAVWYENVDKYSPTTSKHKTQCHPWVQTTPMDTASMRRILTHGTAGLAVLGPEGSERVDLSGYVDPRRVFGSVSM